MSEFIYLAHSCVPITLLLYIVAPVYLVQIVYCILVAWQHIFVTVIKIKLLLI
jgi:hypothetical protein